MIIKHSMKPRHFLIIH